MDHRPPGGSVIGGTGAVAVGVSSVVAAASGYLVLVIIARDVSPAVNADFLVFWSLLFGGFGILSGLQQEATRSVGAAALVDERERPAGGARVLPWSLLIGGVSAALALATARWWQPALLPHQSGIVVVAILMGGAVAFAGHMTLVGVLAGFRRWTESAALTGSESALRLLIVGLAVLWGADLLGLEMAVTASTTLWLIFFLASRKIRSAARMRSTDAPRRMVARAIAAMLATTGSAALVVGYPILMRFSASEAEWTTAAPLVLAVSLTRAPLLIPLNAYQGVAIGYFLDSRRRRRAALVKVLLGIAVVGSVGALLAALVGPWLMVTFFGEPYRVPGALLAALMLAAVTLAVLTVTGAGALALGRHRLFAAGWLIATVVSAGILFVGWPLATRAVVSLAVGPAIGAFVHVAALQWAKAGPIDGDRALLKGHGPQAAT